MAVNLTPLHDRVIVKRIEEKESVKGGIIIPDSAKEKPMEGEIIAVGAGKREKGELIPLDVKPGDRGPLRASTAVRKSKSKTREYLILREEEILAKLSGAGESGQEVVPVPLCRGRASLPGDCARSNFSKRISGGITSMAKQIVTGENSRQAICAA